MTQTVCIKMLLPPKLLRIADIYTQLDLGRGVRPRILRTRLTPWSAAEPWRSPLPPAPSLSKEQKTASEAVGIPAKAPISPSLRSSVSLPDTKTGDAPYASAVKSAAPTAVPSRIRDTASTATRLSPTSFPSAAPVFMSRPVRTVIVFQWIHTTCIICVSIRLAIGIRILRRRLSGWTRWSDCDDCAGGGLKWGLSIKFCPFWHGLQPPSRAEQKASKKVGVHENGGRDWTKACGVEST